MSFRFLDGKPVTHGPVPGAETKTPADVSIPITVIPQTTVICDACGVAMENDGYKRGSKVVAFWCATMKCKYRGRILELQLQSYPARSSAVREGLCDCSACVPDPEH